MKHLTAALALAAALGAPVMAQDTTMNRIDLVRPDAPELAGFGDHAIGVRTLTLTDTERADVLASEEELVTGDRVLTAEFWYPAAEGTAPGTAYETVLRDGVTPTTLHGRAARDAEASSDGPFPLVVISHGYPGNRFLLSHLADTLASRGYAVVALDHADSTYSDQAAFGSTLYNRPLDQRFAVQAMADDPDMAGLVDADRAAVIGYSMGGYGALILGGAGLAEGVLQSPLAPPQDLLAAHVAGSEAHLALPDPRIRAMIAIGPWGRNFGLWDADGLAGLQVPTLFMIGDRDEVSGPEALRAIFEGTTGTRRHLLTFLNAGHNAAAPIPAPAESWAVSETLGWAPFAHYADPVWDTVRMNNIAQHFAAAFLDQHLKGEADRAGFFDLVEFGHDGVWDVEDGVEGENHSHWTGFQQGSALGLRFETLGD